MPLKPIRYPLDRTAQSRDNLVLNERRTLKPARNRVFNTQNGLFYTESFVLRDNANGQVLEKGNQYRFDNFHPTAAQDLKKEVASLIVLTDPNVSNDVSYDYQVVGGLYGYSVDAIVKQIEALNLDNRPVAWGNVLDKPKQYPAAPHLHHADDLYGLQYVSNLLEMIRQAILIGDEASHTLIYQYIDRIDGKLTDLINVIKNDLAAHKGANNPHNISLASLNINGIVQPIQTSLGELRNLINSHIANKNNPHETTPEKLNVYTKPHIDAISRTIQQLQQTLTSHSQDYNNPHRTTASQVNAYTKQETNQLVQSVRDALNALIARRDNPNHVTAAQTGAYTKQETHTYVANQTYTKAQTTEEIIRVIKQHVTEPSFKIKQANIPISTAAYNELRWNKDGLYYGTMPDSFLANLYVDAETGVDEPVTETNGRGTRDKPLKTIAYAMSLGSNETNRNIYIKEGQVHKVGYHLTDFNINATSGDNINRQGTNFGSLPLKGGYISFYPYGPQTDVIPKPAGNIKYVLPQIFNLNTRIEFGNVNIYFIDLNDPSRGFYCDQVNMYRPGGAPFRTRLSFHGIKFSRRQIPSGLLSKLKNSAKVSFTSGRNVDGVQGVDLRLEFSNCQIDTTYNLNDESFLAGTQYKSTFDYFFSNEPSGGYFTRSHGSNNKGWRVEKGVTKVHFSSSHDNARQTILDYATNATYKYDQWTWFDSNVQPPREEEVGVFLVEGGKLFAKVKVGSRTEKIQLVPPVYGDTLRPGILTP